ncbi:MAG: hypothetical protein GXX86_08305 [Propionibacterium sp.]|nr:hypothetical protein [Propionibacterium sp.]
MTVDQQAITDAARVLDEGTAARSSFPDADLAALANLSAETTPSLWLVGDLVAEIADWILTNLQPFQEALDALSGDDAAIIAHAEALRTIAAAVEEEAVVLTGLAADATVSWTGPAADGFTATAAALRAAELAYAAAAEAMAEGHLALGGLVAVTKEVVTTVVRDMITELVSWGVLAAFGSFLTFGTALAIFLSWAIDFVVNVLEHVYALLTELIDQSAGITGRIAGLGTVFDRAAGLLESGHDIGPGDHVADGTAGATVQGRDVQQHDGDLARLIYDFGHDAGAPEPYVRLTDQQIADLGVDPALFTNDATGFRAGIYLDADTGTHVVVFGGTDFSTWEDVSEDGIGGVTVSPQSQNTINLAQALAATPMGDDLIYAGHSLGGRLASVASITTGNGAVIFNAAGVSPATVEYLAGLHGRPADQVLADLEAGQIRSYRTADDLLTNLQEHTPYVSDLMPDALGHQIELGGDNPNQIDGHLMPNVIEEWDKAHADD